MGREILFRVGLLLFCSFLIESVVYKKLSVIYKCAYCILCQVGSSSFGYEKHMDCWLLMISHGELWMRWVGIVT
jgi:hypothetical protein